MFPVKQGPTAGIVTTFPMSDYMSVVPRLELTGPLPLHHRVHCSAVKARLGSGVDPNVWDRLGNRPAEIEEPDVRERKTRRLESTSATKVCSTPSCYQTMPAAAPAVWEKLPQVPGHQLHPDQASRVHATASLKASTPRLPSAPGSVCKNS